MPGPDRVDLSEVDEPPVVLPDIGKTVRRASACITRVGREPGLLVDARAIIVSGVDQLIADRRTQAGGRSTRVQNHRRARVGGITIDK